MKNLPTYKIKVTEEVVEISGIDETRMGGIFTILLGFMPDALPVTFDSSNDALIKIVFMDEEESTRFKDFFTAHVVRMDERESLEQTLEQTSPKQ